MRVALDAMGGDFAPGAAVKGAAEAVAEDRGLEVILVGDDAAVRRELSALKSPSDRLTVRHASEVVEMGESPSTALRRKKDSSITRAVEMVARGEADAAVSAGNSGATMATALFILRKSPGVDRPAIATMIPTINEPFLLLDAGANVDCTPENLLQFALMGSAYSKHIVGRASPRVAIMSIGEEASKGNEQTKGAFKLIEASGLNFTGNIEGKEIFMGQADVVVCDGFLGNVFLKTAEGIAELTIKLLKRELKGDLLGRIGALMMMPAFRRFKRDIDYAEYGGAPLLGINGACIISHGRSSPKAIKNAIRVASEFSEKKVHEIISRNISNTFPVEGGVAAG